MTGQILQAAAVACVLGGVTFTRRPLPGAPLWMLPPLPPGPVLKYMGAVEGWSPMAEVAAAPQGDAAPLALTDAEFAALATDADITARLDAIEADLASELDWRITSALLWLDADLETEHDLATLADYQGDCALRERVLTHA